MIIVKRIFVSTPTHVIFGTHSLIRGRREVVLKRCLAARVARTSTRFHVYFLLLNGKQETVYYDFRRFSSDLNFTGRLYVVLFHSAT